MPDMNMDIRYFKGVGEAKAKLLSKLGIFTFGDLLADFPYDYEDRTRLCAIRDCVPGYSCCIRAMVSAPPTLIRVQRGRDIVRLHTADETGAVDISFFNQTYMKDKFKCGETYIFYGKLSGYLPRLSMTNPLVEPADNAGDLTGRLMPLYHLTAGISQRFFQKILESVLAEADIFPTSIPAYIEAKHGLCDSRFAYNNIHFPENPEALERARRRLVFEELLTLTCAMSRLRSHEANTSGAIFQNTELPEFFSALPYTPTNAQMRAISDTMSDLGSGRAMSRLIQGDVGSGKTLIAAAGAYAAYKNGFQSAYMAPTEILADQHFNTLDRLLSPLGLRVARLKGSMSAKERRETLSAISLGAVDLVVGTHAIISEDVAFFNLTLVVTDEQHRFGVRQRQALVSKGASPHVMVMSATPIPRTLALIIYGDLDVSVIDELPPGRQTIDTFLVGENMRPRINKFMKKLIDEGRQIFVVCPMVEESDEVPENVKSAEKHCDELRRSFPAKRVSLIHGKMKSAEKEAVMAAFAGGGADILVSTTVIEVGVDVPNAALMVVENAERFGLSQLHQLRGRVGRSEHKSYCVLFSDSPNENTLSRLKALCETSDGFKIAETDLSLRGPGDFFGSRQHGLPQLNAADFMSNMDTLNEAQEAAKQILAADPELINPKNAVLKTGVELLLKNSGGTLN